MGNGRRCLPHRLALWPPLDLNYREFGDDPIKVGPTTGLYVPHKTWIADEDAPVVQFREGYRFRIAGTQPTDVTRLAYENGHWQVQRWVDNVYEYQRNTSTYAGGDFAGLPPIQNIDSEWKPISVPEISQLSATNEGVRYYLPDGCGGSVTVVDGVPTGTPRQRASSYPEATLMTVRVRWALVVALAVATVTAVAFVIWEPKTSDCNLVRTMLDDNETHSREIATKFNSSASEEASISDYQNWATQMQHYAGQITDPQLMPHTERIASLASQTVTLARQARMETLQSNDRGTPNWVQNYASITSETVNEINALEALCPA